MTLTPIFKSARQFAGERQERLAAFIDEVAQDDFGNAPLTIIARSTTSPVVQAVAEFARRSGRPVKVVFLEIDAIAEDQAEHSILDLPTGEFRVLNDARFGAAHEQLTLDQDRVWIGDCMRRDPAKRDAFEIYHECHPLAHREASASFARVWNAAKPLAKRIRSIALTEAVIAGNAAAANAKPQPISQ